MDNDANSASDKFGAPCISLIVPTRERADTLVYTLATAISQKSHDYEIIVSDNMSADNTRQSVANINDSRIRYFNTGQRLSMCDNYEFALGQARGDYVIIVGDDDAVVPGMLDFLIDRLRKLRAPVIHMWPMYIYDWPVDARPARATYVPAVTPPRELDLKYGARRAVRLGGWKYYELPSPYHAAIPRTILDEIRRRTGRVFHSTQPDVFTAMAIPAFADRAINLGRTVTFNGRSARSNGLGFINRKAEANLDRFIREYGDYKFHPTLWLDAPARANMIPDAVLLARDMFPELYAQTQFGYSAMWAYICRLGFSSHWTVLTNWAGIAKSHKLSFPRFIYLSVIHEASALRRTLLNRFGKTPMSRKAPDNIQDFSKQVAKIVTPSGE